MAKSKYNSAYIEFLKKDETVEKIADLIEALKMATTIGWEDDHLSPAATDHILGKLYEIYDWSWCNTNAEWMKANAPEVIANEKRLKRDFKKD